MKENILMDLLTVMVESFEKKSPLIITFKKDPIPKKVCKSDPWGQFAQKCHLNFFRLVLI